jgi:hypothetical protein
VIHPVQPSETLIGIASALVLLAGPLLLGLVGLIGARRAPADARPDPAVPWNWTLSITSALLYTLAFNITFFIQELFLVLPKALTPGLRPTLFHNNHRWDGDSPLTSLLQGTGALAIFLTGIGCALLLRRGPDRSPTIRLFLIWMVYNGFLQSLPQVIIGAVVPENDVGMAMAYLHLGATAKTAAALLALAAIPWVGLRLTGPLLNLAQDPAQITGARARTRFVFQVATVPAMTAILLIIPFRIPRNWIEVVMVPIVVTVIGEQFWCAIGCLCTRRRSAPFAGVPVFAEAGHSLLLTYALADLRLDREHPSCRRRTSVLPSTPRACGGVPPLNVRNTAGRAIR